MDETRHTTALTGPRSRWQQLFDRGGAPRALLVAAVYLGLFTAAGLLSGLLGGDHVEKDIFATTASVFFGLTLPLLVGCALLALLVTSLGWWRVLLGRSDVPGRRWMWVAPVVVVVPIVLRLLGIPYGDHPAGVIVLTFATGLLIGFSEELLSRGVVVHMLRARGAGERTVMIVSSLVFALLHSVNLLSGQKILIVLATMGFTFAFGVVMYLTLRVTGSLVWPILLHGLYDPTLFLATGGIDTVHTGDIDPLLALAAPFNIIFIVLALVALVIVRRAPRRA